MTDDAPKTVHIWMADYRSLCDRRPRHGWGSADWSDDAKLDIEIGAPVCGACIVVAGYIRTHAGKLLAAVADGQREIWPSAPPEAYGLVTETRWQLHFGPEPPEELSEPNHYRGSIVGRYSDEWMATAAKEAAEETAETRAYVMKKRKEAGR